MADLPPKAEVARNRPPGLKRCAWAPTERAMVSASSLRLPQHLVIGEDDALVRSMEMRSPAFSVLGRLGAEVADLRQVQAVIGRDPAFAADVVRQASLAFLGCTRPFTSLTDACVRLGTRQVVAVAQAAMVEAALRVTVEPYATVFAAVWRNSLAAARAGALLARARWLSPDAVYLPTLLHNVGELALLRIYADTAAPGDEPPTVEELSEELGRAHETLGEALARAWGLPAPIACVIAHHHRPRIEPEPEEERELRVCVLGGWHCAVAAGYTYLPGQEIDLAECAADLGLELSDVLDVVGQLRAAASLQKSG